MYSCRNGNFPDIVRAGSLPQYLKTVHALYGDVVQLWFGQNPVVSTASPKVFKEQIRLFDKPGKERLHLRCYKHENQDTL